MKVKRSLLILVTIILVACLLMGLVACSGGQQKTADSGQQAPADSENTDQAKDNKDITIGFILMSRSTEFLVAEEWGAVEEAKRQGVELIVIDGENSSERQVASAEDLIAKGVDALILNPYNSGGIVAAVEKANEAGIPVITVDSIAAGGDVDVHVGFDNIEGGRMAAEYLAETLGVKGTVLEIHGPLGAFHAENRHKGFIEVMEKHPDIEVITIEAPEWASDKGREATMDTLTANPDLAAIFSHSDNMLIGAIPALEQSGRLFPLGDEKHMPVVGIDAAPFGMKGVREGWIDVTFGQDPVWMGEEAVKAAIKLINGEEVEEFVNMTPIVVTKENVEDENLWANKFANN